ncbi:amidohydrolase family protein [Burkholderia multivorans]|uniref:amidohydrolase family protein n=1 Tax=Burkholderia multivorans TaxID=87883 RepID=UPI00201A1F60|nr:amidohydrolase family protein [Burkholderia multivorans]MCO1367032.1 amidohydrolase family protein [Burkholderia multivorans]MCO1376641.1 amidohydrolase family protein [Burkholderia multivorans]UQP18594.1 amidohydrolase family protein [Burkholderia multivorans]UQP86563.1 amidohydrolase family protein [Burkholderia multivorans]
MTPRTFNPSLHRQLLVGRDEPILDPDLPIIDAHHHLYDRPPNRYMLDDYLADARAGHRIVASVYLETQAFARQTGPTLMRPIGEIEFANGIGAICASGEYGDCRVAAAIVGYADLRLGAPVAELLDRALTSAPDRFRGIRQVSIDDPTEAPYRFISHRPPRGVMQSPHFREGFAEVVKRGLSFDAAVFHHQLQDIIDLADAFPDAIIVLDHCGHPMAMDMSDTERADVYRQYHRAIAEVARRPNVHCKIGGLGMPFWGFRFEEREDPIGYEELAATWRPHVETCIGAFGAERCMMESNYPPDGRSGGFVPIWNALKHLTRTASPDEKAALFHGTAARVYRIDLPDFA